MQPQEPVRPNRPAILALGLLAALGAAIGLMAAARAARHPRAWPARRSSACWACRRSRSFPGWRTSRRHVNAARAALVAARWRRHRDRALVHVLVNRSTCCGPPAATPAAADRRMDQTGTHQAGHWNWRGPSASRSLRRPRPGRGRRAPESRPAPDAGRGPPRRATRATSPAPSRSTRQRCARPRLLLPGMVGAGGAQLPAAAHPGAAAHAAARLEHARRAEPRPGRGQDLHRHQPRHRHRRATATPRALLVDLDLRLPRLHRRFGFVPTVGVEDCLRGEAELADALVSRRRLPRPDAAAGAQAGGALVGADQRARARGRSSASIKQRYPNRIVIYDLPPVLATDDALAFVPQVDAALMVIGDKPHQARRPAALPRAAARHPRSWARC